MDSGDRAKILRQLFPVTKRTPCHIEKCELIRRQQLLKRPSPGESLRRGELLSRVLMVGSDQNVVEICVADLGFAIPAPHRVDRFGKLRATRFVDAARVYSEEIDTIFVSLLPTSNDFLISFFPSTSAFLNVFQSDFLVIWTPSVRQNSIWRCFPFVNVLLKTYIPIVFDIEKTHFICFGRKKPQVCVEVGRRLLLCKAHL